MTIWMPPPPEPPTVRDTTKFEGPKVLIAIKSCAKAWMSGEHDVIRKTWGSFVPKNVDLMFFMGDDTARWLLNTGGDEHTFNDCPDEYLGLAHKTKRIAGYALQKGYDFVYLCDNDTFVHPTRLLESGFQNYDWAGHFWTFDGKNKYFHGGYGYFLSKRAMNVIACSEVGDAKFEDGWVGDSLYKWEADWRNNGGRLEVGTLPKFSWHFPKDHYPSPKYSAKFPWQEMMMEYHLLGKTPKDREWDAVIGNQTRRVKWNLIDRTCK